MRRRAEASLSGFIFETSTGQVLGHRNIARHLALHLPGTAPHMLRHTYMTNAVKRGVNLKALSELTGDSIETILKVYVHTDDSDLMAAALAAVSAAAVTEINLTE